MRFEPGIYFSSWYDIKESPTKGHFSTQMEANMPFDTGAFKSCLAAQCMTFNVECNQAWKIASSVFAARVREKGRQDWTTIFYFDSHEVKRRDKESGEQYMARELQLLMMMGFTVAALSDKSDDHVRIAYFNGLDPIPSDPMNLVNYASQLFAKVDNGEVEWPDRAMPVILS